MAALELKAYKRCKGGATSFNSHPRFPGCQLPAAKCGMHAANRVRAYRGIIPPYLAPSIYRAKADGQNNAAWGRGEDSSG